MNYHLHPLGDSAVIIEFGSGINKKIHREIQQVMTLLDKNAPKWIKEYVPAFTTLSIFYDVYQVSAYCTRLLPYDFVCQHIIILLDEIESDKEITSRTVEIPVCYGGEFGPDLLTVAQVNGLTGEEVVQIHSSSDYLVYMIGFAPGFPYIGGMSEKIAMPRRKSPRLKIPARSVGIAGMQTGIYPVETPGGWQLIGRTPLTLFRPDKANPSLLKAGDKIKFKPISLEEYQEWVMGGV
ncbi:MAG: 5-oxoprolinase subunit PxpB [Bacillus sp. (in: firmicutes)]